MGDFGFPVDTPEIDQIVGTHFIDSGTIYGLVHTGGDNVYGQYQFKLSDTHFTYCAYTRSDVGSTFSSGGAPGQFEICNNNMDDDGDSLIDCLDDACENASNCLAPSGTGSEDDCTDNVDNDEDTKTDCADSDCNNASNCQPSVKPENCDNGQDDNSNGQIDCSDPLCIFTPICLSSAGTTEMGEVYCHDGLDNDADFLIDCNDPGCKTQSFCQPSSSLCHDGLDNEPKRASNNGVTFDADGLTDCDDPQCIRPEVGSYCPPTDLEASCHNGSDDDNDDLIDCADYYCQIVSICLATGAVIPDPGRPTQPPTENCSDGIDNDLDGRIDCADFNCKTASYCTTSQGNNGILEDCTNYVDNNDDDSYADCADYDCHAQRSSLCIAEQCFNGIDDDGDGAIDCDDSQCSLFCGGAGS
ncbi:MAG: hypothetical protein Q8O99_07380 [bacterium]|nr:hypothetical protein [bacterium]